MPANLFKDWCDERNVSVGRHRLHLIGEKQGVRARSLASVARAVITHYEEPDRLAARIRRWGYEKAASVLKERLPRTLKARSGDLGEILATEAVPAYLPPFVVPIKRLRWKDGRELAMRGEDLIGISTEGGKVRFLKGESKSRQKLTPSVVQAARIALKRNHGRPSAHALAFVMDQLFGAGEDELARLFEAHLVNQDISASQLVHLSFAMAGNDGTAALRADLQKYAGRIEQHAVGFHLPDHAAFIKSVFEFIAHARGS